MMQTGFIPDDWSFDGLNRAHQFKQGLAMDGRKKKCALIVESLNQCKKSTNSLWLGDRLVTVCDYCVALMQRMGRRYERQTGSRLSIQDIFRRIENTEDLTDRTNRWRELIAWRTWNQECSLWAGCGQSMAIS